MLINTVAFAATNSDSVSGAVLPAVYYSTSFKVTCGLTEYAASTAQACKETAENPAVLTNLSGASVAYSYQFYVYVGCVSDSTYVTETKQYTYKSSDISLAYKNVPEEDASLLLYSVYAMLYGYPMGYTTSMSGTLTP